jgi:hypothetical protein
MIVMLIVMITLALTSMLATHSVYAQTTTVQVNPPQVVYDSINGTIGTLFNITVTVTGVDDMRAWQVKMAYNDSIINVTRWYEPTWDPTYVFYGLGMTLPVPGPSKVVYGPGGWLGVGSTLFPGPAVGGGFTGDGLLCILTFNITATPPLGQIYTCNFNMIYPSDTFWMKTGESTKRAFTTYENGYYEYMNPWTSPGTPDIAVVNVTPSKTVIGQDYALFTTVLVTNQGNNVEQINATLCINATWWIKSPPFYLRGGESVFLTFTLNTSGLVKGNYTMGVYAEPVLGEVDMLDNNLATGIITVTIPGDVTGDFCLDMQDISLLADAFLTEPGHSLWNPSADINNDNSVDMMDISIAMDHFMQS